MSSHVSCPLLSCPVLSCLVVTRGVDKSRVCHVGGSSRTPSQVMSRRGMSCRVMSCHFVETGRWPLSFNDSDHLLLSLTPIKSRVYATVVNTNPKIIGMSMIKITPPAKIRIIPPSHGSCGGSQSRKADVQRHTPTYRQVPRRQDHQDNPLLLCQCAIWVPAQANFIVPCDRCGKRRFFLHIRGPQI